MESKRFRAEFVAASLFHIVCLLWVFHVPLLKGQTLSLGAAMPPAAGIADMNEQLNQLQPSIQATARQIKAGLFPAWMPESQGGTPLLGKMVQGTFSPLHIPYWLASAAALPYVFMLVMALKAYAGFAFAYLYARSLQVRFSGAMLVGTFFVFAPRMFTEQLYGTWGAAIFLPLLLLLVELSLDRWRRLALWGVPWAVACSFFAGHFESALRVCVVAAAYYVLRARPWRDATGARRFIGFAGAMALGALLAAPVVVAGSEYVANSYNQVWRKLPEYGWRYHTIAKQLSSEDWPTLAFGLGVLAVFVVLLRRASERSRERPLCGPALANAVGAAAAGAVALACLSTVGLDVSLGMLLLHNGGLPNWLMVVAMLALGFWAWSRAEAGGGLRVLGLILLGSLAVGHRLPPISNALAAAPVFGMLNNTTYYYEFHLALGVLCAAALEELGSLVGVPWRERMRLALPALTVATVVAGAFLGGEALRGWASETLITGINPSLPRQDGGFMGPERFQTASMRENMAGWTPDLPLVTGVSLLALGGGNKVLDAHPARLGPTRGGRQYFSGELTVPTVGPLDVVAEIDRVDGSKRYLRGPELSTIQRPPLWALAATMLAASLLPLAGAAVARGLMAALILFSVSCIQVADIPADQVPYRLPGLAKLQEDRSLFRVSTLDPGNFLRPDYATLYDLPSLRNGGDNLDVLSMIHFIFFTSSLVGQRNPAVVDFGLRLLGAANVKYLIEPPGSAIKHPALEPYYAGEDMRIFRNKYVLPRAAFFGRSVYFPTDLSDWRALNRVFNAAFAVIATEHLDPARVLLLNERPARESSAGRESHGRVVIDEYGPRRVRVSVDADGPGTLLLSDNVFPGWRATVDGRPAPLLKSWFTFRAVEVPVGRSIVEFEYRPARLWLALTSSALLSALLLGLFFVGAVRPLRDGFHPAPAPASVPLLDGCAAYAQTLVLILACSGTLFWSGWTALVYNGSPVVRGLGALGIVGCVGGLAGLALRSRRTARSFSHGSGRKS